MENSVEKYLQEIAALIQRISENEFNRGYKAGLEAIQQALQHVPPVSTHRLTESKIDFSTNMEKAFGILPRGVSLQMVESIFRAAPSKALSPVQVAALIEDRDGKKMAETTLRRAIEKLENSGTIERIAGTPTWRLNPTGPARLESLG